MSHVGSPKNKNPADQGVAPIKQEYDGDFKVIVAIDFGTHGTGLGYALVNKNKKEQKSEPNQEELYTKQDWNGRDPDNKNKTDILLKQDGTFVAFGDQALDLYLYAGDESETGSESPSEERDDEKGGSNVSKHLLFESFKMALYEQGQQDDAKSGDIRAQIKCKDGRMLATKTVFVAALTYIKNTIFEIFEKKNVKIDGIKDIQWILTVPAIWSDRAKYKMEYYSEKAGLIDKKIFNHLKIVYEPDCASISCQSEAADQDSKSFDVGERYVLIDAGGGTVDIAWHQVKAKYSMEEIHHCTGGPWGSDYIDEHFEELLKEIFSDNAVDMFKQSNPANYTKIIDNFRKAKMSFYTNKNKFHSLQLTMEFMDEMVIAMVGNDKDVSGDFNRIIDDAQPFGIDTGNLKVESDILKMSSQVWRECLFDKVIDPMIKHVTSMIPKVNDIKAADGHVKNIKYLCIAGGLASSKYFQHRIHEAFGMDSQFRLSIRIPIRPILSVIEGALKLGLNPNYIATRRLKYTYGIAVDRTEKNVDLTRLPQGYLDKNVYKSKKSGKRIVRNLFSKWVKKHDPVEYGVAFEKEYSRMHQTDKTCKLSIYSSGDDDPYVVSGKPLASVIVEFPTKYKGSKFTVKFYFGDTKISATVDFGKNQKTYKLELDYQVN